VVSRPHFAPRTAVSQTTSTNIDTADLQYLREQLLQQRINLIRGMSSGVAEVETPGVGRVQNQTVDEMAVALQYLDSELGRIDALLGSPKPGRRPIHLVAIE